MIDLQELFKGGDIQFSSLIVYHCRHGPSRYCLVPLSRARAGFSPRRSFHYPPPPPLPHRPPPPHTSTTAAASGCPNFPVSQPESFPFGEEAAPSLCPFEQQRQQEIKNEMQNGLAWLLVNSPRCRRTSVIPLSWRRVSAAGGEGRLEGERDRRMSLPEQTSR